MSKKILIVDDSKTIRQQANFTLSRSGYTVVEAEDGLDGIEKLKANPDVAMIISDVNMPNMKGIDMAEAINGNPDLPHPPIVMLTTEGSADLLERAKKAGARCWLVKPFVPDQLIAVVQKLTA